LIVAVKGAGGFHLACRADEQRAVAELRRRKGREEKPFAVMAASLEAAGGLGVLAPADAVLAGSPQRPIVIVPRRADAPIAAAVAPGSPDVGLMLPSTPLHHLLLGDSGCPLVMTSGNASGEPIVCDEREAIARLGPIADLLVVHDRPIHARIDDSVARPCGTRSLILRRARGYVPDSIPLPQATEPLLACGAELKSTFCLARDGRAWVSQHLGDLRSWETLRLYRDSIAQLQSLFSVQPRLVAHDLHPDYLSTGYALEREGVRLLAVQHHHAHLAAVLAEHGERGPAVAAVFDGAGLGSDATVWGGELLAGDLAASERVGHLLAVPLPGGDAAAREPWRMACAWLRSADPAAAAPAPIAAAVGARRWEQMAAVAEAAPVTSSIGRLFDAVAAICGVRLVCREEGWAAALLEAAARATNASGAYPMSVVESEPLLIDARETVLAAAADVRSGVPAGPIAARFHEALARASAAALQVAAARRGAGTAVLAGGVFQNRLLLERCCELLETAGMRVLTPRLLPPGDGAISYGQAAAAGARCGG
jgi:hydrogenase maturation protein HypF